MEGQIADVGVFKNAAYLQSWAEAHLQARRLLLRRHLATRRTRSSWRSCRRCPGTYHGEGAQARTINTTFFNGDMLAVNNEPCGANGVGGFDLYDVSDPANPKILVQGAGDQSPDEPPAGEDEVGFADTTQDPAEMPNSAHSIFIWQDGREAPTR